MKLTAFAMFEGLKARIVGRADELKPLATDHPLDVRIEVAYVSRERADEVENLLLTNRDHPYRENHGDRAVVRVDYGNHAIFMMPYSLEKEAPGARPQLGIHACREALQEMSEATFLLRFGEQENGTVCVTRMTGELDADRPAIAFAHTPFFGKDAEPWARGVHRRQPGDLTAFVNDHFATVHHVAPDMKQAVSGLREYALPHVEREHGQIGSIDDRPKGAVVLNLSDGFAFSLSGDFSAPLGRDELLDKYNAMRGIEGVRHLKLVADNSSNDSESTPGPRMR